MSSLAFVSIEDWQYRDTAARARETAEKAALAALPLPPPGFTEEQVALRVQVALAAAEERWKAQAVSAEADAQRRDARMLAALEAFALERSAYFRHVESEIVHLSLAVAKKILDREAQLDPTLLGGLVRIALDRLGAESTITLRMPPDDLDAWRKHADWKGSKYSCEFAVDDSLQPGDCVVETSMGTANFGFSAQLKEIEQGLLGILAQRPERA